MFAINFSYASATPLPPNISISTAIETLHDFDTIVRLSPDCRGCKPIAPPKSTAKTNGTTQLNGPEKNETIDGFQAEGGLPAATQYFEVEDDLPFIPKRFWNGSVKYQADFLPVEDGCDITVHALGGFTSVNHWRVKRDVIPEDAVAEPVVDLSESKDLMHAEMHSIGWYVQIVSDARCNRTFAGFVKGFLKNSHVQLQRAFVERLQAAVPPRTRRPTLGRRRSSEF